MADKNYIDLQTRISGKLKTEFEKYCEQQDMKPAEAARDLLRQKLITDGNKSPFFADKVGNRKPTDTI